MVANRDEMRTRPWLPPDRHWPDRPEVVAGRDSLAGGTWLGVNDHGVVATVLNREGTLGPAAGKRSRGELVLDALDFASARDAASALADLNGVAYRPFNLIVADAYEAFWLRNATQADGRTLIDVHPVPDGLSFLTAFDLNDPKSPRTKLYKPRFEQAPPPDPAIGDWAAWEALAASLDTGGQDDPRAAMRVETPTGFETVNSSLIALNAPEEFATPPGVVWRFAAGKPGEAEFLPIACGSPDVGSAP